MLCDRYRNQVRALARRELEGHRRVRRHAASCLRCQAEMARERRMQRQMRSIRREPAVPRGLFERILATIDEAGPRERRRGGSGRTVSVVAGAGALAGVIVVGLGTRTGRRVLGLTG